MALALGAPPTPAIAKVVADNLAADVRGFGNKTTCGITGLAWMLPQLEKFGHGELALAILKGDQVRVQEGLRAIGRLFRLFGFRCSRDGTDSL